jgi:hypothetical protein
VSHQCAPGGLFIGVITHGHYNVCTAPFIYPNLSLCSHGVITVFYDLQIFLCLTNGDVTCVLYATMLETEISGVLMIFGAIRHCFEASCAEVTFGAIHRAESLCHRYRHKMKVHYGSL